MRSLRQRSRLAVLLAALAVLRGFAQGAPAPASLSAEARAHLMEIIAVLQREWLHRDGFDWSGFTRQVMEKAETAQTIPETYDAIRAGLKLLGDKHTYYIPASSGAAGAVEQRSFPAPLRGCAPRVDSGRSSHAGSREAAAGFEVDGECPEPVAALVVLARDACHAGGGVEPRGGGERADARIG